MVELKEDSYILGYWMTAYDDVDIYIMGYKEGDKYVAKQTFRYHSDNPDPYSGEDRKSVTTIKISDEVKNDIADYKIIEFIASRYHKDIEKLVN